VNEEDPERDREEEEEEESLFKADAVRRRKVYSKRECVSECSCRGGVG